MGKRNGKRSQIEHSPTPNLSGPDSSSPLQEPTSNSASTGSMHARTCVCVQCARLCYQFYSAVSRRPARYFSHGRVGNNILIILLCTGTAEEPLAGSLSRRNQPLWSARHRCSLPATHQVSFGSTNQKQTQSINTNTFR